MTVSTEYTKVRLLPRMVVWDVLCAEFRWINLDALVWIQHNVKSDWKLVSENIRGNAENPVYHIAFADEKDAIMFKLLWL